ncbi:hypothetical protein PVK06_023013 [Gossypium arboreum]|uniref:Uncharacterized protein n=1 Tax=Gossypium arboreum TaxID=29729 RepID=A0ABR0PA74_GOSAR|nr:hypothetical protein PVK06_023013 [Gossypium arboreum]
MDVCKTYSERTFRGARGISSHESRGVRSFNSHILKEFACGGLRDSTGDPKRYTYLAYLRSAQNFPKTLSTEQEREKNEEHNNV